MGHVMQPLLFLLAHSTHAELSRQVQYLRVENRILRDKLPRSVRLTDRERQRLLRYGLPLGPAIKDNISVVTPRTFARWVNGQERRGESPGVHRGGPGRRMRSARSCFGSLERQVGVLSALSVS